MVQDYCPSGTELVQGGWYSTSKDPPIEFLSAQEVYDVEEDSQRIQITLTPTNNPETSGRVWVGCLLTVILLLIILRFLSYLIL